MINEEHSTKRAWRKVLYERQTYPDNYTDPEKFLDQLCTEPKQKNSYHYCELVTEASSIALQFTVASIFLAMYKSVLTGKISNLQLFMADWSALILMLFFNWRFDNSHISWDPIDSIRKLFISGVCLRVSAPILQTLTSSFSNDTIHALALTGSAFHLLTFDYQYAIDDATTGTFSGAMSLNAAVFTAVLLASRLQELELVVAFILFAAICFSILPGFVRIIRQKSIVYHVFFALCMWSGATALLVRLDYTLLAVYEFGIVFLWLLCPLWLKLMFRYKKSLRGPWEEAVVVTTS